MVCIRYRARTIAGVKAHFKQSHRDLSCRFCSTGSPENQEYLEICGGTGYEKRGLDMSRWWGILTFWRRMTMKLMEEIVKKKKNELTHNKKQWKWWPLIATVAFKPINFLPCVIWINVHVHFVNLADEW